MVLIKIFCWFYGHRYDIAEAKKRWGHDVSNWADKPLPCRFGCGKFYTPLFDRGLCGLSLFLRISECYYWIKLRWAKRKPPDRVDSGGGKSSEEIRRD